MYSCVIFKDINVRERKCYVVLSQGILRLARKWGFGGACNSAKMLGKSKAGLESSLTSFHKILLFTAQSQPLFFVSCSNLSIQRSSTIAQPSPTQNGGFPHGSSEWKGLLSTCAYYVPSHCPRLDFGMPVSPVITQPVRLTFVDTFLMPGEWHYFGESDI